MSVKGYYHKKYNGFYASKEWIYIRDSVRARDTVCQDCLKRGIVTQGTEVHHIIPIEQDYKKRFDVDNCILLCKSCHDLKHPKRLSEFAKFFINLK